MSSPSFPVSATANGLPSLLICNFPWTMFFSDKLVLSIAHAIEIPASLQAKTCNADSSYRSLSEIPLFLPLQDTSINRHIMASHISTGVRCEEDTSSTDVVWFSYSTIHDFIFPALK